ncbi:MULTISPECIES: hypothetical protein [unclassified Microbacterium]|uniref:hypothetical protein n=1 Tax=unclassified Microbacterium TaxID=2609290 RepID=UPI00366166FB
MFIDYFPAVPAIDFATGNVVPAAEAQVYARTDTTHTTPLPLTDLNGIPFPGNILKAGPTGIFPDFLCTGYTEVTAVSGTLTTPIESYLGRLMRVLPDPVTLAEGATIVARSGVYVGETPVGADIRHDAVVTTGTLAVYANGVGTVLMRPSYALVAVTVNRACRVRLYASTAQRDADVTRPRGTDPDPTLNHGLMVDLAFSAAGSRVMAPSVFGSVVPYGPNVPWTVTNLDATGPAVVQVTLTYMRIEQ